MASHRNFFFSQCFVALCRYARTELTVEAVLAKFEETPCVSTRTVARGNEMPSSSSVWRILKESKFHPYKMESHQELKPQHQVSRVAHAVMMSEFISADPHYLNRLMFSDEAHFSLHGNVNCQNFRYWSKSNPHWYREHPLHSPRLTVWAAIGYPGIIGPIFFQENVTGERYLALLQNHFFPAAQALPNHDQIIFMQDGAPPHWSLPVRNWLTAMLPGRWMGRGSPNLPWPANSPDLTPCDFFLWGYVKSLVYQTEPADLTELRGRIQQIFDTLPQELVNRSVAGYHHRLQRCIEVNGMSVE
jgi:hypothetical protein